MSRQLSSRLWGENKDKRHKLVESRIFLLRSGSFNICSSLAGDSVAGTVPA